MRGEGAMRGSKKSNRRRERGGCFALGGAALGTAPGKAVARATLGLALAAGLLGASPEADALGTIKIGENQSINFMVAMKAGFTAMEDAAPSGNSWSKDFTVSQMRLYVFGQATKEMYFMLNTDRDDQSDIHLLDAQIMYQPSPWINAWVGRILLPAGRVILESPQWPTTFNFPIAWNFPNQFNGRDDGAALWGNDPDGKIHYQLEISRGVKASDGAPNVDDDLMYTGYVTYNLFDGEPGYYRNAFNDYKKKFIALGAGFSYQDNAVGTVASPGAFQASFADVRVEWPLGDLGGADMEAGFFHYDLDDKPSPTGLQQGNSMYATVGYMLPGTYGIGKLEPRFDYTQFNQSGTSGGAAGVHKQWATGLRYLLAGHNIRFETFWFRDYPAVGPAANGVTAQAYLAF